MKGQRINHPGPELMLSRILKNDLPPVCVHYMPDRSDLMVNMDKLQMTSVYRTSAAYEPTVPAGYLYEYTCLSDGRYEMNALRGVGCK